MHSGLTTPRISGVPPAMPMMMNLASAPIMRKVPRCSHQTAAMAVGT
jgi:hypothetical protein